MSSTLVSVESAIDRLTEELTWRHNSGEDLIDPEDLWFEISNIPLATGKKIDELPAVFGVLLLSAASRQHETNPAKRMFRLENILNAMIDIRV